MRKTKNLTKKIISKRFIQKEDLIEDPPEDLKEDIIEDLIEDSTNNEVFYESVERIMNKELKNIIRICDICGGEMLLYDKNLMICQDCGYHLKIED